MPGVKLTSQVKSRSPSLQEMGIQPWPPRISMNETIIQRLPPRTKHTKDDCSKMAFKSKHFVSIFSLKTSAKHTSKHLPDMSMHSDVAIDEIRSQLPDFTDFLNKREANLQQQLKDILEHVQQNQRSTQQQLDKIQEQVDQKAAKQQVDELQAEIDMMVFDMSQKASQQQLLSIQQQVNQKGPHEKFVEVQKQVVSFCDEMIQQAAHVQELSEAANSASSKLADLQTEVLKLKENTSWIDVPIRDTSEFNYCDEFRVFLSDNYTSCVMYPHEVAPNFLEVTCSLLGSTWKARVTSDNKGLLLHEKQSGSDSGSRRPPTRVQVQIKTSPVDRLEVAEPSDR